MVSGTIISVGQTNEDPPVVPPTKKVSLEGDRVHGMNGDEQIFDKPITVKGMTISVTQKI